MTISMKEALETKSPAISHRHSVHSSKRESFTSINPFQSIVTQVNDIFYYQI